MLLAYTNNDPAMVVIMLKEVERQMGMPRPPVSKYYLAAKFDRREELRAYRTELQTIPNSMVISRWLDDRPGEDKCDDMLYLYAKPEEVWPYAQEDLDDISSCDVFVSFTGPVGRGGRHIEHGYAMAGGLHIVLIGRPDNIFHCDPRNFVYPTWNDFIESLRSSLKVHQ
jgi:hypothetical protein